MSTADFGQSSPQRVRDQARAAIAVMAFSALTSVALAATLVWLTSLAGQR
jgi:hypothetical protein